MIPFTRVLRILFFSTLLSVVAGCASIPFLNRPKPQESAPPSTEAGVTQNEAATPVDAGTADADREAALRALPEGAVVIEEKEPGFLTKLWGSATSIFKKKKPEAPVASAPTWIGTIKVVNQAERYVLIDSNLTVALPPGEILNSVGNDFESGTVRTTADRVHPFFIADIASGNPAVGDRVYSPK
ncbi:MAG: hypothetical protein ACOVMP_09725 [Chthoniobacterales bacterium]